MWELATPRLPTSPERCGHPGTCRGHSGARKNTQGGAPRSQASFGRAEKPGEGGRKGEANHKELVRLRPSPGTEHTPQPERVGVPSLGTPSFPFAHAGRELVQRKAGWWGGGVCSAIRGCCTPNLPAAAEYTQKSEEEPSQVTTKDFSRGRAGPGYHLQPCWILPTTANCLPRRKKPGI